ncbi:hypothetical protein T03_4773 [Trichinella britovi]|uniref:Uncharacterized protein n=1 Tax=Trichinella britovi TaxID=45882 RepID=A0A0V1C747_TRIBR|nr:hypothetical protein T03_4773 [Trichinella britovi]
MAAAAKALSRKLAANKLSIDAVDDNLLGGQQEFTEALFRETDALQAEWEQDLEAGERKATGLRAGGVFWKPGHEPKAGCGRSSLMDRRAAKAVTAPTLDKLPPSPNWETDGTHAPAVRWGSTEIPHVLGARARRHRTGRRHEVRLPTVEYDIASSVCHCRHPHYSGQLPAGGGHLAETFRSLEDCISRAPPGLVEAPEWREMTRQGIQTLVDEITKQLRCLAAMGNDPHAGELPWS